MVDGLKARADYSLKEIERERVLLQIRGMNDEP